MSKSNLNNCHPNANNSTIDAKTMLGQAIFMNPELGFNPNSHTCKMYFFYISNLNIAHYKAYTRELFLNMTLPRKPLRIQPLVSKNRPIIIADVNYFKNHDANVNVSLKVHDHLFGLICFPSKVDPLSESKIESAIRQGTYSRSLDNIQANWNIVVSEHSSCNPNSFDVNLIDFFNNASSSKQVRVLPFNLAISQYRNDQSMLKYFANKSKESINKVTTTPHKHV
jgi:hypothetical protein